MKHQFLQHFNSQKVFMKLKEITFSYFLALLKTKDKKENKNNFFIYKDPLSLILFHTQNLPEKYNLVCKDFYHICSSGNVYNYLFNELENRAKGLLKKIIDEQKRLNPQMVKREIIKKIINEIKTRASFYENLNSIFNQTKEDNFYDRLINITIALEIEENKNLIQFFGGISNNPIRLKNDEVNNVNLIREQLEKNQKIKEIQKINLSDDKFRQVIGFPHELIYFIGVNELVLPSNMYNVKIMQLQSLKSLKMGCFFSQIPKEISTLPFLENLHIENGEIIDIKNIHLFSQLTSLTISKNRIKNIPDEITYLTNLTSLDLHSNEIEKINKITLIRLEKLDLGNNKIKKISNINRLTNLKDLNISNNNISKIPRELVNMNSIRYLDLSGNCIENPARYFEGKVYTRLSLKDQRVRN